MYSSLAELVTQRRTALGYTMRYLAARVGVSSAYIAHIEHGRIATPSPPVLAALARELHVSEEMLLRAIGYLRPSSAPSHPIAPMKSLAQLVKQAREARGLTQAQVDELIGMSTGYTGMVESGRITRPRQETLRKLEMALGIAREDMLVATGELDAPSEDMTIVLQRIAALPDRRQRLEAWGKLPESLRSAVLVLMQDMLLAGAQQSPDVPTPTPQENIVRGNIAPRATIVPGSMDAPVDTDVGNGIFMTSQAVVCGIFISTERDAGMIALSETEIIADWGLKDDRKARAGSKRQVLLVDEDTLRSVDLKPGDLNENLTIRGMDINGLQPGQQVRVGGALLEVTGPCTVCGELETVRAGLKEQLRDRRGVLSRVIESGTVRIGDPVVVVAAGGDANTPGAVTE
jgi:transcriptional regulator with XRE-family HTH domain